MKAKTNRWLYLAGALLLVVTLACSLTAPDSRPAVGSSSSGGPAEAGSSIEVTAREFEFTLSADQVAAGTVTFTVTNEGTMPHDFVISIDGDDVGTAILDPGESETLEVTLEPGTYEYVCTVPGHAMLGMRGELTVVP